MRKTLLAAASAVALVCGLAVTAGTAAAATPRPADRDDISCSVAVGATTCVPTAFGNGRAFPSGFTAPTCAIASAATAATTCTEDYTGPRPAGLFPHPGLGGVFPRPGLGLGAGLGVGLGGPEIMCPLGEHRFGATCVPGPIPVGGPLCPVGTVRVGDHCVPGSIGLGGPWHPGLPWVGHPVIFGTQLWLDANLALNVCDAPTFPVFLNRFEAHRAAILGLLGANAQARWLALHAGCGSTVVVPSGLTLVNRHFLNLALLGVPNAGLVDVCSFADWNTFNSRLALRFGAPFGAVRARFGLHALDVYRQLRLQAACSGIGPAALIEPAPVVVDPAVQDPAPVVTPAAPATPAATPAPAAPAAPATDPAPATSSSTSSSAVPSGSVNTGGYDAGFLLLWPWAR